MDIVNLTPHAITLRLLSGDVVIPPSGQIARVATEEVDAAPADYLPGVPVVRRQVTGDVTGLPDAGVPCLVSAMVLAAVPGRAHTFAPDTGATAIRNADGHIVAVTRLVAA